MHIIDTKKYDLRTDLLVDSNIKSEVLYSKNNVELLFSKNDNDLYSTIFFIDPTDKDQSKIIQNILIQELRKYITKEKASFLIIGLGNRLSTADSLGPKVLDNILVTRHLFELGEVEEGYSNVSIFVPGVTGSTGLDSVELIKHLTSIVQPDYCILIDSLCTSSTKRLNKTIQITNTGIHPGSGVLNDRGELSSKTLNTNTIAIGVPTVVDLESVLIDSVKNIDQIEVEENLIVTPKEIDFLVESTSNIISNSINKVLHKAFISTK